MVNIHVKLYATLQKYAPEGVFAGTPFAVEVPAACTIEDLILFLNIPESEVKVVFVNGRAQKGQYVLHSDDTVGIFSPVGGG